MSVLQYQAQRKLNQSGPWLKTCNPEPCTDRRVQLLFRRKSGKSVFKRGRLEVVYEIPVLRERYTKKLSMVLFGGSVSVQCGYPNFRSYEDYPSAFCGKREPVWPSGSIPLSAGLPWR